MHLRKRPETIEAMFAALGNSSIQQEQPEEVPPREMEVESNGANNDEYIGAKDDCKVARDEQHTSVNPKCSCSQKDRTDTALERPSDLLSSEKDTIRLRIALETISQLEKENEMLESSIRKIQTKTFKRFDSSNWAPDSNEDISRKLDRLESSVRSWAKRHSIPNMRHVQTATPLPPKLLEILKDFAKVEEDLSPLNLPDDKAYVLVEAYVMHQLYCDVFDDPFLWLSDRAGTLIDMSDDAQKTPSSRALRMQSNFESLYEEFRDCDARAAVAWRVQTLRQLRPSAESQRFEQDKRGMTCDRTNTAQKKASVRLANEFLDSAIVCLVSDPTREETRSSLAELVLQAIKLSYLLWTQMIHLAPKFINNPMIGTTFEHNNPLVEPHRLLNKYPDDLEGSPILLLTHPALMQHGNDDGTDFTVRSLLKKAIYWTAMPRPTA